MTMADKIIIRPHRIKAAELSQDGQWTDAVTYVRKDLAAELARALELFMMSAHDYQSGLQEGEDALARYNAATEKGA